jgi:hypothetical protein
MPLIVYKAYCPFCKTLHRGEIEMKYRKDGFFNVRKNNKNIHICKNDKCGKEFLVEIDSYGNVIAIPTYKIEEEGIFPWEMLAEGKILEIKE